MNENSSIVICDPPQEVNYGSWLFEHPDCDTIVQHIGTGPIMLVFAYSLSKEGNEELMSYRNYHMPEKTILAGVSADGIRSILSFNEA